MEQRHSHRTKLTSHEKNLRMTQLAILTAITALLSFFMLPIAGVFELTLAMIPVAIGAILLGPVAGTCLGGVFGICSYIQCFGISAFGTMLFTENPFFAFLVCVPTRILMGFLVAVIYKGVHKLFLKFEEKHHSFSVSVASLSAPVLNTVFFLGMFALLYINGASWTSVAAGKNAQGLWQVLFAMAGINAIVEIAVCAVIGSAVVIAVQQYLKSAHR